ncbi:MAG: hypothetical protein HY519_03835 [Candidatus Aenigmarchaeota archaeon]|nr:hypothetical protein [Candidatus Aenigmarchaeota archaeon]
MHELERELFDKIVAIVREFQERRSTLLKEPGEEKKVVAMLDSVPAFVGLDTKTYGPFAKSDVVTLPAENAKFLVDKGLAEEMKLGNKQTV